MGDVGAVILAAGLSTRMGDPKVLRMFRGKPLFLYAVETAVRAGLDPVYVVGGAHTEKLKAHVQGMPVTVVHNPDFALGMATSLRVGISAIDRDVSAAFVFLADEPFIPDEVVQTLLQAYRKSRTESSHAMILRPRYAGVPGHPVLFPREFFPELVRVQGDEGARCVIKRNKEHVQFIDFDNPEWGFDIDTPEDWQKALDMPLPTQ
jgi:molybdenum cofactor cytidylyltransferase